MSKIWLLDDDASLRWVLSKALTKADFAVDTFDHPKGLLAQLPHSPPPDLLITDIGMPDISGLQVIEQVHKTWPELPIVVITAFGDLDHTVQAYRGGAFEYLVKPFDLDVAIGIVRKALRSRKKEEPVLSASAKKSQPGLPIIGESVAMQEIFRAIGRLSHAEINVLITGESGTGKELIAQALHQHSPRADKPFVAINTAAIPKELLESELFGHEKGAFTGAAQRRVGRFEQAHGGTLFLDEIGDMPLDFQTRLLRVLASGAFYRVGGHEPLQVDVRIIAATHQPLEKRVAEHAFREDLFHRLNVVRLHLPPLRARREDIPLLLAFHLQRAAAELNAEEKTLHPDVIQHLQNFDWPGNIRQLANLCRWLTVMAPAKMVEWEDLPEDLQARHAASLTVETAPRKNAETNWQQPLRLWSEQALKQQDGPLLEQCIPMVEKILLETALHYTRGHRQEAAALLGWGRNTLARKIKELGLEDS